MVIFSAVLLWGSTIAWIVFQLVALLRLRGRRRALSTVPLFAMSLVLAATYVAYRQHSNLWPLALIFASVPALVFLLICIGFDNKASKAILREGAAATCVATLGMIIIVCAANGRTVARRM